MLTRRTFSTLAAASAAAVALPFKMNASPTRSGLEFGVQLYTVRSEVARIDAMLALIAEIGYATVETFDAVYNRPAKELKAMIQSHGLKAPSGHFDYATLEEKVDYAAELGLEYMICPGIAHQLWNSVEGFRKGAAHLNKAAAKAHAAGIKFGYHPHNYEFKKLEGGRGFDVLMKELDPIVRLELDVYWATEAGENAIELMRKNRARLELIHIKDRKPGFGFTQVPDEHAAHFTEAGSGSIDWKAVLGEARHLGVKQFFVDQDGTDLPLADCLRANWKYLSQLQIS